jgi:serine/threonine-protein kinase
MPDESPMRFEGPDPMRGQFFSNAVTRLSLGNPSLRALSPRYCLVRPLGAARGIESYLMQDRQSGDVVCARVLSKIASEDSMRVDLFRIRTGAASVLNHPGVVGCSLARHESGAHYAIVEHKEGCDTLRRVLDREGWFDFRRAARVAYDLFGCLDYARSRGIIHLCLAPDNVLIHRDGRAFLDGFGLPIDTAPSWALARPLSSLPQYSSPEQLAGQDPDARSDLYSVGVLLFEMLTDRLPFNSVDQEVIRHRQSLGSPRPPTAYREDVPPELADLTLRLVATSSDARFQDAGSAREALARWT